MKNLISNIEKNKYDKETKYKLISSFEMLEKIDCITNYFTENPQDKSDAILMHTFGLLQSLFVGIDSLYNLTYTITNNKYYININQNEVLHELKFIRNDVVGHPTNRKYGKRGIGFTKIDTKLLTSEKLTYETHIFENKKHIINNKTIYFNNLIKAYNTEKNIIINRLNDYITKEYKNVELSFLVKDLYLNTNINNIEKIENEFIKYYGNFQKHRFLWRLRLLKKAITLKNENKKINDLLRYSEQYQALKLYEISLNMENRNKRIPKIPLPNLLNSFFKYLNKNPELNKYIYHLHDARHPFFKSDLEYLIKEVKNENSLILLKYLNSLKDNDEVFLIGSIIKSYRVKK